MNNSISAAAILILALYFLPSMLAASRKHLSASAIFFLNLFLGWTFLGWVAAFVWACTDNIKVNRQREQERLARLIALQTGGQAQPLAALPPRSFREEMNNNRFLKLFKVVLVGGLILYVVVVGTRGNRKDHAATATPTTEEITTSAKLSPAMSEVAPELATSTQAVAASKPASPPEASPVPAPAPVPALPKPPPPTESSGPTTVLPKVPFDGSKDPANFAGNCRVITQHLNKLTGYRRVPAGPSRASS